MSYNIPGVLTGTIAISLIVGSYATETFRGAFLGVNQGSIEAAKALGMSQLQLFIYIRIPEMWRIAHNLLDFSQTLRERTESL